MVVEIVATIHVVLVLYVAPFPRYCSSCTVRDCLDLVKSFGFDVAVEILAHLIYDFCFACNHNVILVHTCYISELKIKKCFRRLK